MNNHFILILIVLIKMYFILFWFTWKDYQWYLLISFCFVSVSMIDWKMNIHVLSHFIVINFIMIISFLCSLYFIASNDISNFIHHVDICWSFLISILFAKFTHFSSNQSTISTEWKKMIISSSSFLHLVKVMFVLTLLVNQIWLFLINLFILIHLRRYHNTHQEVFWWNVMKDDFLIHC